MDQYVCAVPKRLDGQLGKASVLDEQIEQGLRYSPEHHKTWIRTYDLNDSNSLIALDALVVVTYNKVLRRDNYYVVPMWDLRVCQPELNPNNDCLSNDAIQFYLYNISSAYKKYSMMVNGEYIDTTFGVIYNTVEIDMLLSNLWREEHKDRIWKKFWVFLSNTPSGTYLVIMINFPATLVRNTEEDDSDDRPVETCEQHNLIIGSRREFKTRIEPAMFEFLEKAAEMIGKRVKRSNIELVSEIHVDVPAHERAFVALGAVEILYKDRFSCTSDLFSKIKNEADYWQKMATVYRKKVYKMIREKSVEYWQDKGGDGHPILGYLAKRDELVEIATRPPLRRSPRLHKN